MIDPQLVPLKLYKGGSFSREWDFYDDTAKTQPHSFTGWTLSMAITYRSGATAESVDTTVSESGGKVTAFLTPVQTAALTGGRGNYILKMTNNATGDVEFLFYGPVTFVKLP